MSTTSVIIPTYNGSAFIREALESVFTQTLLPNEIIVVDDASTDGTPELVEEIAKDSPVPLKLIRLTENSGGPARPMNVGIEASQGEFVALLDQDDRMASIKIETSALLLNRFPDAGLAFGQCHPMRENGIPASYPFDYYVPSDFYDCLPSNVARVLSVDVFRSLLRFGYKFGGAGGTTMRKTCWLEMGTFNEHYPLVWDWEFAFRLGMSEWAVAYAPSTFFFHRIHQGNLSKGSKVRKRQAIVEILKGSLRERQMSQEYRRLMSNELAIQLMKLGYGERLRDAYIPAIRQYLTSIRYGARIRPALIAALKAAILGLWAPFRKHFPEQDRSLHETTD